MIKSLKIGHLKYTVKLSSDISEEYWGKCNYDRQELMISNTIGNAFTAENVLHEAFHASWRVMNQKAPEEKLEEYCVRFASKAMCMLLSQNPKLIDYLKEGLK